MKFMGWKYGLDESAVENHGDMYPYIESPEGTKLWLADIDPRQRALAERLVEAANLGYVQSRTTEAKSRFPPGAAVSS